MLHLARQVFQGAAHAVLIERGLAVRLVVLLAQFALVLHLAGGGSELVGRLLLRRLSIRLLLSLGRGLLGLFARLVDGRDGRVLLLREALAHLAGALGGLVGEPAAGVARLVRRLAHFV